MIDVDVILYLSKCVHVKGLCFVFKIIFSTHWEKVYSSNEQIHADQVCQNIVSNNSKLFRLYQWFSRYRFKRFKNYRNNCRGVIDVNQYDSVRFLECKTEGNGNLIIPWLPRSRRSHLFSLSPFDQSSKLYSMTVLAFSLFCFCIFLVKNIPYFGSIILI